MATTHSFPETHLVSSLPQCPNVDVPLDEFVLREERGILFSGRGHNDLVSGVTVEWLW